MALVLSALVLLAPLAGCLTDFTGPGTNDNDNVPPGCGNGVQESGELCDGTDFGGQTCGTALGLEFGDLQCTDVCLLDLSGCHNCGNGIVDAGEDCDDFNHSAADGCSELCQIEVGWLCMGEPSVCSTVCGDGITAGVEECDDGNTQIGDGCNSGCTVDPGWVCSGDPSVCNETCGNGVLDEAEGCDDGNLTPGDGCSDNCAEEPGWQCSSEPSVCDGVCGDGLVLGNEACDDGNTVAGDGCLSDCTVEAGWTCDYSAEPPVGCTSVCGDGILVADEACDDGNSVGNDGCDQDCSVGPFSACDGEPSVCICVVYVDRDVAGVTNSGADWASAFAQLSDGLQVAENRSTCEVWVAEGVYYTYQFSDNDRLDLRNAVSLYGGFAGDETWRSQRDFATRVTVLSGEQENDPLHRVRRILDINGAVGAIVDGFTIGGALNQTSEGAGARIQGGSDVELRNCIFQDNVAEEGAAIYLRDSVATVSDSVFLNNEADKTGGAIMMDNNGSLVLERCLFDGNSADDWGGGICVNDADFLTVDRCRFVQNTSPGYGGAISLNNGGIVADITNSVFWQNSADQGGGGIEVFQIWQTALVTNCTFYDNESSAGEGASLRATSGDIAVRNTILWGSVTDPISVGVGGGVTCSYSDVYGGASGVGMWNIDPAFVAPLTGDLRLSSSSSCIDAADGDVAPALDLDDNARVDIASTPDQGVGSPSYVDIGAYEYHP